MTTALFGIPADASVAFAEPKNAKRVDGAVLAKTVARRATEEERWRYGVELRITGSRWRPQTRAPHYPAVEPYVYRKRTNSLAWAPYQLGGVSQAQKYEYWLAGRDKAAAQPETTTDDDAKGMCGRLPDRHLERSTRGPAMVGTGDGTGHDRRREPALSPDACGSVSGADQETSSRDAKGPAMTAKPTADIVRLVTPTPAREDLASRKADAAELLREIAGQYGPRRAHKLRAMADWLTAAETTKRETRNA